MEELLYSNPAEDSYGSVSHKEYIINSIIETGCAEELICTLAHLISYISVFRLHIIGDVYDRGPAGEKVIEELMKYNNVDTWYMSFEEIIKHNQTYDLEIWIQEVLSQRLG